MRVFFCLFLISSLSCSNIDSDSPNSCVEVIYDHSKYDSIQNFGLNLIEYSLEDLCLKVKLGVSGCDEEHTIDMVTHGAIVPADPTIVFFDFYDNNPQLCEAYFTLDREYDLHPVKDKYNEDIIVMFRNNQGSVKIDN